MANKNRKRTFFDGDTEHGLVKRIMYKKYLQAYIEKTQSEKYTLRTMLIDGFAGVGRYGNEWPSEIERYGSPLIALIIALGVCYRKDMKKQKQQNEEQRRPEDSEAQGRLKERRMQNRAEENGMENKSKEIGMPERSKESRVQERLEKSERQESSGERAMHGRSQESTAECKTHEMSQNGQEENPTQETSTLEESTGGPLLESSKTEKEEQSTRESLWGWPASEMDPEAQLDYELKQWNRRRTLCKQLAKISFIFIENDQKNYIKLCANVELLIMNFLKRCYPSHEYGLQSKKDMVRLDLNTDPFSISIKIVKGKFAETNPPSELNGGSVRSLTFLDPFGFTQTPMMHVAKFAPGPGNEVFINFMSSYVNRFVSRSTEGVLELYGIDPPEFESDDDLAEFVNYVIHFCEPEREHYFSNEINKCTSNYEAFLKRKTNSRYSLTFEVKDKRNTTIYHMIHITNHIRGVEAMKESMNRCSQREGEMIMSEYDIVRKGQKLNLENLDDPIKVAEAIFNKFRGMKRVQIADIQKYILFDTNYLFRKTPLKKLKKARMITDVIDTKVNTKKKKSFPCKDKNTKEPIVWFSFADEEYTAENIISTDVAEAEKERSKQERKEVAKKRKEEKEKEKSLKKERQREKKKKIEEERLVKIRKKEERMIKNEEVKRKRDEARRQKEESKKSREEKAAKEMRSQKLITDILRSDSNQPVVQAQIDNAGKISGNCNDAAPMEVDNASGTGKNNEIDDMTTVCEKPSGSGMRKEMKILQGKGNGRNDKTQTLITSTFVSQKRIETPLTGKATERKTNKTRKRKVPETLSNKEELAKRRAGTSGIIHSSSDNVLDRNEEISSNCERGKKPLQKVLTEYFQRENNFKM
ncbi:uncharacterized protein LOC123556377 [Mercenaria mercenaria]|uniref:uncharacterized protein LOC123556377 n=1 Tax=Mercenaria mercenaria TaxID=6596 RepID=UPI00234E645A|nr:uncharacterized protein LOC123556377 [Mercenaria mercenaria]XP_045202975.2 uncharacterized protein LOC123556377 [Mercenaria mercenaria]